MEGGRGGSKVLQPHKCDKIYVWFSGCLLVSLKVASHFPPPPPPPLIRAIENKSK